MPPPTIRVPGHGGVELAVHHLGGDGPPVMLAHATGFHGRCWIPLARQLTPEYSVWALDQRGHGQSDKDPDGRYDDWSIFAADLLAVIDAIDAAEGADATHPPDDDAGDATPAEGRPGRWRIGGHSLGGGVALLAEARRPGTFRYLACYEPVVFPPSWLPAPDGAPVPEAGGARPANPLATLARKRRPGFASRQEAYDNYRSKPPFAAFDESALRAYVDYGLVDLPDGTVTLACRREDEAAVFEGAAASPTWSELPAVRAPVAIMAGGDLRDPVAVLASPVARRLPRAGLVRFPALDHFGPMTDPEAVGDAMRRAFAAGCTTPPSPA